MQQRTVVEKVLFSVSHSVLTLSYNIVSPVQRENDKVNAEKELGELVRQQLLQQLTQVDRSDGAAVAWPWCGHGDSDGEVRKECFVSVPWRGRGVD
jgi:hypothetical protein